MGFNSGFKGLINWEFQSQWPDFVGWRTNFYLGFCAPYLDEMIRHPKCVVACRNSFYWFYVIERHPSVSQVIRLTTSNSMVTAADRL